MRAVACRRYGTADELRPEDVPRPVPGAGEVLLRVHASTVNSWDWEVVRGVPYLTRIGGFRRPRWPILGADVAGTVVETGEGVEDVVAGDEVFGDLSTSGWGGFAEFATAPADLVAPKPDALTFEQAATLPQAGGLAFRALHGAGHVRRGQQVMINGAGGGAGTFGVQIAHAAGAHVTGVDAGPKLATVREAGADEVIDYTTEEVAAAGEQFDLIVDTQMHRSMFATRRTLRPGGTHVVVGGSTARILGLVAVGAVLSRTTDKRSTLLIHRPDLDDLRSLAGMAERSELVPVIEDVYPLERVPDAIARFARGDVCGKLVISTA